MDTLFYKVIHNKYLFYKILSVIQETEWTKFNRINEIHIRNKIKFINIKSLEWIVNNGQYELLKCKLENGEIIEFDQSIIEWIFSFGKILPDGETSYYDEEEEFGIYDYYLKFGYYRDVKELLYYEKSEDEFKKQVELKINNFKKFQSLLYHFKDQLKLESILDCPLYEIIIRNKLNSKFNIELVESIFSDNHLSKLEIEFKILENAINYSTPKIINNLLYSSPFNNPNYLHIENKSIEYFISLAIQNEEFKNEVIEYLIINHEFFSNKQYIVSVGNGGDGSKMKYDCKKLMELMSMDSELIYKEYLLKYDEIIESLQDKYNGMVILTGLKVFSVNILKNVLLYHKQITMEQFYQLGIKNTKDKITKEFLIIYSLGYNWLDASKLNSGGITSIIQYFHKIPNQQDYELMVGSILNKELRNKLPLTWNSIYNSNTFRIIINNKETVDWLFENVNLFSNKGTFVYSDREALEYSKLKSTLVQQDQIKLINEKYRGFLDFENYDKKLFTFAIFECNIQILKQFKPNDPNVTFEEYQEFYDQDSSKLIPWFIQGKHQIKNIFNWVNQTADNLNKLLKYLNETGYKHFTSNLYKQLLISISTCKQYKELEFKLLDQNGKFNEIITELFIDSLILEISPLVIQLLLTNDIILESTDGLQFTIQWSMKSYDMEDYSFYQISSNRFSPFKHSTLYYHYFDLENGSSNDDTNGMYFCRSGESYSDIMYSIELIFKLYNFNHENSSSFNSSMELIINHLFKRLIRVVNVEYQHIDKMYKLISNKWFENTFEQFEFNHTIYHSFYYLGIKSIKLIKFILSIPRSKIELGRSEKSCFDKSLTDYEKEDFHQKNYENLAFLDHEYYSYDYIFNTPFQDILESLIEDLVIKEMNTYEYCELLETTITFLLEIREIQLFFKFLSKIQALLDDIEFRVGNFPTIKSYDSNSWNNTDYNNYHDEDEEIDPLRDRSFEFSYQLIQTIKFVLNEKSYNSFIKKYPNNLMFGGGSGGGDD